MAENPEVVEWIYADKLGKALRQAQRRADEIVRRGYDHTIPVETYDRIAEVTGTLAARLEVVTDPNPEESKP